MLWRVVLFFLALTGVCVLRAQSPASAAPARVTVASRWRFVKKETVSPLTLLAGAVNASVSQTTRSDPEYGAGGGALAERFGAAVTDVVSQDFFVDFVMASAFHENTRYERRGPAYGNVFKRAAYAVSRAFVTRKDTGGHTFNFANLTGSTLSLGLSNLYYPPASRTAQAIKIRYAVGFGGSALVNLYPEFWPDFRRMLQRHHLFPRRW